MSNVIKKGQFITSGRVSVLAIFTSSHRVHVTIAIGCWIRDVLLQSVPEFNGGLMVYAFLAFQTNFKTSSNNPSMSASSRSYEINLVTLIVIY